MRTIKHIVFHCTAGWQTETIEEILLGFKLAPPKGRGWKDPGYHHVIMPDGKIHDIHPIEKPSNGVLGFNEHSINIAYVGGIKKGAGGKLESVDNRTLQQESAMLFLSEKYGRMFPDADQLGHRDFSVDKNGNGIIDVWEYIKMCPCFDVRDWLKSKGLNIIARSSSIVYKLQRPMIKDVFVVEIQKALNEHGIKNALGEKITVDKGFYGAECDFAIKQFQKKNNIPVTGICDEETKKALGL